MECAHAAPQGSRCAHLSVCSSGHTSAQGGKATVKVEDRRRSMIHEMGSKSPEARVTMRREEGAEGWLGAGGGSQ